MLDFDRLIVAIDLFANQFGCKLELTESPFQFKLKRNKRVYQKEEEKEVRSTHFSFLSHKEEKPSGRMLFAFLA